MRGLTWLLVALQLTAASNALAAYAEPADDRFADVAVAGSFETTLFPARVKGPVPADAALSVNVTLERDGTPTPAGIAVVTITAPAGFVIDEASTEATFAPPRVDSWGSGNPLAGRWFAQFLGVSSPDGDDTFTLDLSANATLTDGFYAFDVQACENALVCTTGDAATPKLEIDGTPPAFTSLVATPSPLFEGTGFSDGNASLVWTIGDLANVTGYALSQSPLGPNPAYAAGALPTAIALAPGADGTRTIYASVRDALGNAANRTATISVDLAPPTIDAPTFDIEEHGATGWWSASPTIAFTAADGAGSGVETFISWLDEAAPTIAAGTSYLVPEGWHNVSARATDFVDRSATRVATVNVDLTAPTLTSASVAPTIDGWHASFPTATIVANDPLSGIASARYRLLVDEAPATEWTALPLGQPVAIAQNGASVELEYEIEDVAGHAATGTLGPLAIDTVLPPKPALALVGPILGTGATTLTWTSEPVTSPSGFLEWRVFEGDDHIATIAELSETSIDLGDLVHGEEYAWKVLAVSGAGLVRASDVVRATVDLEAPDVQLTIEPAFRNGTWYTGPDVVATLTIDEAISALGPATYTLAGETHSLDAGANAIPLPEGRAIALSWSVADANGHLNADETTIDVDTTPPVIGEPSIWAPLGSGGFYAPPVYVNYTVSEAVSDLVLVEHSFDGVAWLPGSAIVAGAGVDNVHVRATNSAGLTSLASLTIEVDALAATADLPTLTRALQTLSGSVEAGASPANVTVDVDGEVYTVPVTGATWTLTLPAPLADGAHAIVVHVSDEAGRASAPVAYDVVVDGTPPTLAVTLPEATNLTSPILTLGSNEPLAGPATYRIGPAGGAFVTSGTISVPGSVALPLPNEGTFAVRIEATDVAGNPTSVDRTILRDTLVPDLAQTSPSSVLHANTTTLRFIEDDATSVAMELHVELDEGGTFDFIPVSGEDVVVPLAPGTRLLTYTLRATDAGGNVAVLAGTVRIVDPSAPTVAARVTGELGNAPWLLGPATVQLATSATDATIHARADGAAFAAASTLTVSGAGIHRVDWYASAMRSGIEVRSTPDGADVPIDLAAPSLAPLALPTLGEEGTMLVVRVDATDDASGVASVRALLGDPASPARTATLARVDGVWTGTIGPMPGAPTTLTILAEDAAGRSATLTQAVDVADTRPPLVVLAPLGTSVLRGTVALSASATDANGIEDLWFEVNGARLETSTWDTLGVANGLHTLAAVARDPSNNLARDEHAVRVLNLPTLGEPRLVDDVVAVDITGPAPWSVVAYARIGASTSFEAFAMSAVDGAFRTLAIPIAPGQGAEVFVVATREGADVRSPLAGTLLVQRAPPADLASWGAERDVAPEIPATTPEHNYIDIVDAGVIVGGGRATFGIEVEGALDTSQPAAYVIQFLQEGAVVAAYNVSYTPGDAASWNVRLERAGASDVVAGNGRVLSLAERSIAYSLPLALLSSDLGGVTTAMDVRFAAYGSFDTTSAAALDVVPPAIVHTPPAGLVAGSDVVLSATSEPGAVLWAHAEIAGVSLAPVAFSGGAANLGRHDVTSLTYSIVATDTAGNVRVFGPRTLNDTVDPVAAIGVLGGGPAEVAQGQSIAITGEASFDGVGVVDWLWDLDGDGATDARGRRVSTSFASAGTHAVGLTVLDAAGNDGRATLPVLVRDVTAPTPFVVLPAAGAVLRAGQVSILVSAGDAAGVGVRIDGGAWRALTYNSTSAAWRLDLVLAEGPHTLRAAATDAAGNRAESAVSTSFFVDATPPTVALGAVAGEVNQPLRLRATASDAGGIASMRWDFGDGTIVTCAGSCPVVDHTYASGGDFTATVRVVDVASYASTASASVHVVAPVTLASIGGPSEAYAGDAVAFTPPGEGTWRWNFGDGSFATAGATSHVFATPGDFIVFAEGLTGTYSRAIRIVQRPGTSNEPAPLPPIEVSFAAPSSVTVGEPATLTAGSFADAIRLDWDFGDGTSASGRVVQHAWSAAGTYSVRLDVMLANGQTGSLTRTIDAKAPEPAAPPRAEVSVTTDPMVEDEAGSEAEETTTPAKPALPVTKVSAPAGLVASPATVTFDAGPGTVVYWRFDKSGWHTTNPALIGGEGSVVVEFYAVGAGGREETRSLTLDLDGLSPGISRVSTTDGRVSARIDDAHLASAQARVLDANGEIVGLVDLVADGDARAADLAGLAPGAYTVEIVARDALGRETVQPAGTYEVADTPLEETALEGAARETPMGAWPALVALGVALLLARRRRSG